MKGRRPLLLMRAALGVLCAAGAAGAQADPSVGAPANAVPAAQWPVPVAPPQGAPNILVILTDDVGFGSASAFGGPVPTPVFDALARDGLRYNRFHTSAICSPTRASLLTGRNPHAVGVGYVTNWATPYPGYNSRIPDDAGTVADVLKAAGYNTAMFGKGHVTPEWEQGAAGPFDRWPTGLGFEYFYGFLGADQSAFQPALVENTRPITVSTPDADYHLDKDLADRAIAWIDAQHAAAPDRPFFLYLAPGAAHAPNHAPKDWLARFRGQFDGGWDQLRADIVARQRQAGVIPTGTVDAPRPEGLPRWDSLSAADRRLYARYMEAYAASLSYADAQIGRVIDAVRASGELENTLIVYIQGDNGASAEGSHHGKLFEQSALAGVVEDPAFALARIDSIGTEEAYNLYPGGWGWAMNAPFQWAKRYASHFGGTRNAMVISWPRRISEKGGLRSHFAHVSDIMPTLLEAAGVPVPEILDGVRQQPLTGISLGYSYNDASAPSRRHQQLFATSDNLAIYRDGWVAATVPTTAPWGRPGSAEGQTTERRWQLFDVDSDFSQSVDLAERYPDRLSTLKQQFQAEALSGSVLPIHSSEGGQAGRPDLNRGRRTFVYRTPVFQVHETAAPPTVGRSFAIRAKIGVGPGRDDGVIVAHGGRFGGYSLQLNKGRPAFTYVLTPAHIFRLQSEMPLAPGDHDLRLELQLDRESPASGATVTLSGGGKVVAEGRLDRTFARIVSHTEGFDVGADTGTAVEAAFGTRKNSLTASLHEVAVEPYSDREGISDAMSGR